MSDPKYSSRSATITVRDPSLPLSNNKHLLRWIQKMVTLTQPAAVHWVDGSEEENDALCQQMVEGSTFIKLKEELWPGCYYAKSDPGDVARVEDRTFICSLSKDAAGPTNNWANPYEMRRKLKELFNGCMRGRTMYVLPFSMGHIGSPMSQIGVQLTDSPCVVVNMRIMARIGLPVYKEIDAHGKRVVPCVHSARKLATFSFLRTALFPLSHGATSSRSSAKPASCTVGFTLTNLSRAHFRYRKSPTTITAIQPSKRLLPST